MGPDGRPRAPPASRPARCSPARPRARVGSTDPLADPSAPCRSPAPVAVTAGPVRSSTPPQCPRRPQPAPHHGAQRPSGSACHAGVVTGHPPTHGHRAGTARADGPRTGEPPAADAPVMPIPAMPTPATSGAMVTPASRRPASRAGPPCTAASDRPRSCGSGCAGCSGSRRDRSRGSPPTRSPWPGSPPLAARRSSPHRAGGGRWSPRRWSSSPGARRARRRGRAAHRPGAAARGRRGRGGRPRRRPAPGRDPRRARCAACLVRRRRGPDAAPRVPPRPCRSGGHARRRRAHGGRAPDPAGAGGGRLPGRRHPARRHPADGLGLGDGVRDRLGRGRRRRARPPLDRSGTDDPAPLPRRRPRSDHRERHSQLRDQPQRTARGDHQPDAQAGPTRSATIFADRATIGSPPPGCADPPTR